MIKVLFILGDYVEDLDFFSINSLLHKCRDYVDAKIEYTSHMSTVYSNNGFPISTVPISQLGSYLCNAIVIPGSKNYDTLLKYRDEFMVLLKKNIMSGCKIYTICSGAKLLGELGLLEGAQVSVHKTKQEEYAKYKAVIGTRVEKRSWLTSVGHHPDYIYVKSVECFFQVIQDIFPPFCMDSIVQRTEIRAMNN